MKTTIKILSVLLITTAIGCADKAKPAASAAGKKNGWFSKRTNKSANDTSFAAGSGRKPTANTTYSFAKILVAQGRDRDALYVLQHLLRDHPTYIPAYNEIAEINVRSDRMSDALSYLNAALKHAPHDAVLQNNIGMCHLLADRHIEALEAFNEAVNSAPTVPTYRANRAAALALLGKTAEAETDYRSVLSRHDTRANLQALAKARQQTSETPGQSDSGVPDSAPAAAPSEPSHSSEPSVEKPTTTPSPVSLKAPTLEQLLDGDQEISTQ